MANKYSDNPTVFDLALNATGDVKAVWPLMLKNPSIITELFYGMQYPIVIDDTFAPYTNKAVLRDFDKRQITVHTGWKS